MSERLAEISDVSREHAHGAAGRSLAEKLLRQHLVRGAWQRGEEIALKVDQALLQDATGTMASLQYLELRDIDSRISIPLAVQYVDHNTLQLDFKNPDDHRFLQSFAARHGIYYSRPGNGICHYLHVERFARPGDLLIGADSHTTTSGALGMIAVGAGGLEVAIALAGMPFEMETPRIVGVELRGSLPPWVQAKDIILELLRRRGVRGGLGRIFEFYGTIEALGVAERATICNMIAELGATTGLFPSDGRTREWLEAQGREQDWRPLAADQDAAYDEIEVVDLSTLEPLIAKPSSPGNVVPVCEVAGIPVGQVCVGSSVNSGYEDLAIVAAVLRGRTLPSGLVLTVTPGSRQILGTIVQSAVYAELIAAGARMLEPACGPCVGMGLAPATGVVSVRTFNRNFPGRSGTFDDRVYLASPATAAATALRGVITDPRELGATEPALLSPPTRPDLDDRQIIAPLPPSEAERIELIVGPNIERPPAQQPLPAALSGRVLIVAGDDVSTGDLSPDGAEVMAFRSNVGAMANFVFRRLDPEFVGRARQWGGGFVVAGFNYGQGSSREHAAIAPRVLGVRAVLAKSFARIHRRNLVSQGIVPLSFVNEGDYQRMARGLELELPTIRAALASGRETVDAHVANTVIVLAAHLSQREREVLLAGGLIAQLRSGRRGISVSMGRSGMVDQGSMVTNPVADETSS
jgi:aconitate hydratase